MKWTRDNRRIIAAILGVALIAMSGLTIKNENAKNDVREALIRNETASNPYGYLWFLSAGAIDSNRDPGWGLMARLEDDHHLRPVSEGDLLPDRARPSTITWQEKMTGKYGYTLWIGPVRWLGRDEAEITAGSPGNAASRCLYAYHLRRRHETWTVVSRKPAFESWGLCS